jgi:hypothetical protein
MATAKPTRMIYTRNEAGLYVCPDCGITKEKQNTMHYHMKTHLGVLPNTCQFCKKNFLQKQQLDTHLTTNAGKGSHPEIDKTRVTMYECPFEGCVITSSNKGQCRIHCMRKHMGKETAAILERGETNEISCKECSKSFLSLGSFYYHTLKCVHLKPSDTRKLLLAQLF